MTGTLVVELARFLTAPVLSVDDVVARVGKVTADPGVPMAMILRPHLPGVRAAKLWRYPDTGLPYLLRIEPASDEVPTVRDIAANAGPYDRSAAGREKPPEVIFRVPVHGERWSVTTIAEHARGVDVTDNAAVASVTFRRDSTGPRGHAGDWARASSSKGSP
jgi:hypothetical protein